MNPLNKEDRKIIGWAGFVDGKIAYTEEDHWLRDDIPAIYRKRKYAKDKYEDVRKVEIKELT